MIPIISLGQFKAEASPYHNFLLTYEDPLSPLSFSIRFIRLTVNLSASPYIAFKNDTTSLCLSHVSAIKKYGSDPSQGKKGFILVCDDYSLSDTPCKIKLSLKCY